MASGHKQKTSFENYADRRPEYATVKMPAPAALTALLAALIFGEKEHMSGGFYLGASIIVASVISLPVLNHFVEKGHAVREEPPRTSGLP